MKEDVKLSKVEFRVEDGEGGVDVETLWAEPLGCNEYKLDNSPFFAYGISWQDTIEANPQEDGGFPLFQRVLKKSGNQTIRIIFDPPLENGNVSELTLQEIVSLGCSFEGATSSLIAVNIPPEVKLEEIRKFLIKKELQWEHADPTYAELFRDEKSAV